MPSTNQTSRINTPAVNREHTSFAPIPEEVEPRKEEPEDLDRLSYMTSPNTRAQ
jgi:hypothetical protein